MPQARIAPDRIAPAADAPVRGMVTYTPAAEQNAIRMTSGTTLKIDKLTISDTGVDTVSDTELDLQKGRIFANVKKLSPASQYLIKIPTGIAGVRGGEDRGEAPGFGWLAGRWDYSQSFLTFFRSASRSSMTVSARTTWSGRGVM